MDREVVELNKKNIFSKRGKTHRKERNQASYSTKHPNNILSFQKISQQEKYQAFRSKTYTHTHTHTHTHSHYTSLTNFIFQKQVKTV